MTISPEKLAFIKGESKTEVPSPNGPPATKAEEKTVDLELKEKSEEAREQTPRTPRRSNRRFTPDAPGASEVLDQVLVPITVRLPHRMAHALRRAYLEQKLRHAKPDTLQEIGKEAFADWLDRNGYLD